MVVKNNESGEKKKMEGVFLRHFKFTGENMARLGIMPQKLTYSLQHSCRHGNKTCIKHGNKESIH